MGVAFFFKQWGTYDSEGTQAWEEEHRGAYSIKRHGMNCQVSQVEAGLPSRIGLLKHPVHDVFGGFHFTDKDQVIQALIVHRLDESVVIRSVNQSYLEELPLIEV